MNSHLGRLTVAVVLGCSPFPLAGQSAAAGSSAVVVVEKDSSGPWWVATWRLDTPARELRFEGPAAGFRPRTFEVLTPGYRLLRDGEVDVLRTEGQPAREVRLRFPEFDRQLSREYEFFRRFSDGGVAIFTGHLVARPLLGDVAGAYIRDFRFVPPEGSAIVVDGQHREGPVEWSDASGRGTYVYIGAGVPLASQHLISIVDPGLPDWIEQRTRDVLPRLFEYYSQKLDAEPAARPVVLFDYQAGAATGYGGGTLPGLIQLSAEGTSWESESRSAMLQLLHLLAHEAAHVWNGEIVRYPGIEDAWMHEGSADALAERALLALGVAEEDDFLEYQTEALNDCRAGLLATPLRPSAQRGKPRLAYTCGNMIALLTEAVLFSENRDLFDFWSALIAHAGSTDGLYEADDYRAIWRMLGATDQHWAAVDEFLSGTMNPERLAAALVAAGVEVEEAEPPADYGQSRATDALAHLMSADCGGRVGFRRSTNGFVLDRDISCGALEPGSQIVAIGGQSLLSAGHLAYDHVQQACATASPAIITFVGKADQPVPDISLSCPEGLPARPAYLRIKSRPLRQATDISPTLRR